jgi:hypothetical protein
MFTVFLFFLFHDFVCSELRRMEYGPYFVQTKPQAFRIVGARILKICTHPMKRRDDNGKSSLPRSCGLLFWSLRSRQELLTFCTRYGCVLHINILRARKRTVLFFLFFLFSKKNPVQQDACNAKSNHQHLGTIKSSNLCTEIVEYTAPDEVAVCNLASISLGMFVDEASRRFDFDKLAYVVGVVTRNLNRVIDLNFYPVTEAKNSNLRHRPIGMGVQGLADAFIKMRLPFESAEAAALNVAIFETMYFSALSGEFFVFRCPR